MYNTGSQSRGFSNGYVGRVVGNAGVSDGIQPAAVRIGEPMPATDTSAGSSAAAQLAALVEENTTPAGPPKAMPAPPPPSWDVFAREEYERATLAEEGANRRITHLSVCRSLPLEPRSQSWFRRNTPHDEIRPGLLQ